MFLKWKIIVCRWFLWGITGIFLSKKLVKFFNRKNKSTCGILRIVLAVYTCTCRGDSDS